MTRIMKYNIILTKGNPIQIDEDEVEDVLRKIQIHDQLIRVRQNVFNSSRYVQLEIDEERTHEANTAKGFDGKLLNRKLDDLFKDINITSVTTKQLKITEKQIIE